MPVASAAARASVVARLRLPFLRPPVFRPRAMLARLSAIAPHPLGADADTPQASPMEFSSSSILCAAHTTAALRYALEGAGRGTHASNQGEVAGADRPGRPGLIPA